VLVAAQAPIRRARSAGSFRSREMDRGIARRIWPVRLWRVVTRTGSRSRSFRDRMLRPRINAAKPSG
jgi:hypothetical protein